MIRSYKLCFLFLGIVGRIGKMCEVSNNFVFRKCEI